MNDQTPDLPSLDLLKRQFKENDGFMNAIGAELVEIDRGSSKIQMQVRKESLSFNGTCHGGAIFSLADCAFGVASNSYGTLSAGIDVHIVYTEAARLGDVLTATAREVSRTRKIAVYDIKVKNDKGALVASFTGTVYILGIPNYKAETAD